MADNADQDDGFLMEFFPQWMQGRLRAMTAAGQVTAAQAAAGGLLFLDRVIAAVAPPAAHAGRTPRTGSLDFITLVPDPADRPAALDAYRVLLTELPRYARARVAAAAARAVPRAAAVAAVAGHYESRDAWIFAACEPEPLMAATMRLGALPGCACWLDNGTSRVLAYTGEIVAALAVLFSAPHAPPPAAVVIAVPRAVPPEAVSAALGEDATDGSKDLILLTPPGRDDATWPELLVRAVARSDPGYAAALSPGRRRLTRPGRWRAPRRGEAAS